MPKQASIKALLEYAWHSKKIGAQFCPRDCRDLASKQAVSGNPTVGMDPNDLLMKWYGRNRRPIQLCPYYQYIIIQKIKRLMKTNDNKTDQ